MDELIMSLYNKTVQGNPGSSEMLNELRAQHYSITDPTWPRKYNTFSTTARCAFEQNRVTTKISDHRSNKSTTRAMDQRVSLK